MNLSLFNSTVNKADDRPRPCHFFSWLLLLYTSPKQMPRLAAPSWIVSELCFDPKQAHMFPKPGLQWKTGGCPFGRHINHLWHLQGIHPVSNSVWVPFTLEYINSSYSYLESRTTAAKGSSGSHFAFAWKLTFICTRRLHRVSEVTGKIDTNLGNTVWERVLNGNVCKCKAVKVLVLKQWNKASYFPHNTMRKVLIKKEIICVFKHYIE